MRKAPSSRGRRSFPGAPRLVLESLAELEVSHLVKIGAPHFVDFRKSMEPLRDGKAYLVQHGADYRLHFKVSVSPFKLGGAAFTTLIHKSKTTTL